MYPETRGSFALVLTLCDEALFGYLLVDKPGLGDAVHASSNFDIDVTVFGDFGGKFLVLDDVVG